MQRPDIDYDELNPGIRETVRWLRSLDFDTVDSGDGETHEYECDRDEPYVVVRCHGLLLCGEADRLARALRHRGIDLSPVYEGPVYIQASYDPANEIAVIELVGVKDDMLRRNHHAAT